MAAGRSRRTKVPLPGASRGRGLGLRSLRHVERCSVPAHVLDTATPRSGRDPILGLDVIETESKEYGAGRGNRPRLVIRPKAMDDAVVLDRGPA